MDVLPKFNRKSLQYRNLKNKILHYLALEIRIFKTKKTACHIAVISRYGSTNTRGCNIRVY